MPFNSTPWARQDGYARLPFDPARATASDLHAGGITFLDLSIEDRDLPTVAGYLDAVPAWLLARPGAILVRWPEVDEDSVKDAVVVLVERLRTRGISAPIGLVAFPIGGSPTVVWSDEEQSQRDAIYLQRARRVELASFLHWGGAVWRPRGYHYALPSGRHARTFVRPADAFVDIRAAAALSTWLRRWVQLDTTTAVIADSGTLGPIVTELRAAADRAEGARIGPVLGIDTYPPSPFGLPAQLLKATDGQPILGLVSVSDTGRLSRELREMLRGGGATDYHIEQLITRGPNEESGLPPTGVRSGVLAPWLALADAGSQPAAPGCEACDDPSSARIVRINPRSMSAMLLPEPTLLMLDLTDARRNAVIWQEYQKVKAPESWISFVGPIGTRKPGDTLEGDRDSIFFEPAALVRGESAPELLRRRRNKLDNLPRRQGKDGEWRRIRDAKEAVGDAARVVVIDGDERRLFNDDEWARFRLALAPFLSEAAVFVQHDASAAGEPILNPMPGEGLPLEPTNVLIVALGLRTGVTLHRMFLTARQRWPRASHRGLVIHAHPDDDRIWASARNTFTDSIGVSRLVALWLTYVPRRSPLAEEARLLHDIPAADIADEDVRAVLVRRTQMLKPTERPDNPLWGPLKVELRAQSYLGENLGAAPTLAAVGAALQSARIRARPEGNPDWAMVDIPRIFRSFFDGLIHACVLRWCAPGECWWGDRESDCIFLLHEIKRQMMKSDWELLLPELLLASLQGKVPSEGVQEILAMAQTAIDRNELSDVRARGFVMLGLELARRKRARADE